MAAAGLASVFGARLRSLREAASLTQEQLGTASGVDYKHIGSLERGEKTPSFDAIEKLADALHIEYYELFLPDDLSILKVDASQALQIAIREVSQHGSPTLKKFLSVTINAARNLLRE